MTRYVHVDSDNYKNYMEKGHVVIGELKGAPNWVEIADPEYTCLEKMRGGKLCLLSRDHKAKGHSSVVFYCEGCDRTVKGEPYVIQEHRPYPEGEIEDTFHYCFPCVKQSQKGAPWQRIG